MEYDTMPLAEQYEDASFVANPVGPSSRGCCKILNGGSCGSGSLVGKRNGKSLLITNAHVASSRVGNLVKCTFPFLNNRTLDGRVIMAAYSDQIFMDWAVVELPEELDLPHSKLSINSPTGRNYTAGYPRCQGPRFQEIVTRDIIHNGTVWRWTPNAIGGQSGSGVHSVSDNLQYGLLAWSWNGFGAGMTARSIWFQYVNRAEIGFVKPEGYIELAGTLADDLENGFFAEANIVDLPIWAHRDPTTPPPPPGNCKAFQAAVLKQAEELQQQVGKLIEFAKGYVPPPDDGSDDTDTDNGGTFGL